jgi:tetraacyldisaccharide 4'-kinase
MRAPDFWYRPPGLWSALLSPLGALYAAGTARRLRRANALHATVPVICVGNLNAGGTGKTPTVIALVQRLAARGVVAHVVSRGYGGALAGPVQVNETRHTAADVGDEPLLMAAFGPVWVAKDRAAGVQAAQSAGAQAVILDDGFQNPSVAKDISIVVVDARQGFGNGRVIPAGPLREPVSSGLARADFLLSIGAPGDQKPLPPAPPVPLRGALKPLETGMDWRGVPVFAFAGIGQPDKFFRTLADLGAEVRGTVALSDHQPLTQSLLTRMGAQAAKLSAQPVTTEKDAVRLPPALRGQVMTVPVRLEVEDWAPLDARLDRLFT